VGVRLGAPAIGLAIGKYLPDGRNVVGLDLFPNYGNAVFLKATSINNALSRQSG
jgi:hypothetical protein